MNDARYWTSLYVAGLPSGFVPPRAATRKAIWDHIRQLGCNTNMEVRDEEEKPALFFNGTLIDFRVNDAPRDGVYLLAFLPTGKNAPKWYKADSQNASRNVLDFCDLLGSSLTVEILEETFAFKRESYVQSSVVDISEWEVVCPYGSPARKELLRDFISEIRATGYENVYRCIPQDSIFHVFTDTYINGGSPLTVLNKTLSDYGKIFGPRSLSIVKEFGEKLEKKQICAFIFLETGELLERCYRDLKIFFDSNNMPTQYVSVGTISDKIRYPGV
ncbi:hypothetical protein MUP59_07790, partial [Candidatus Bathyarchaeota archaeon]|nr:hypothetical protein [Candidatus Bathyarchaeota archaeon]